MQTMIDVRFGSLADIPLFGLVPRPGFELGTFRLGGGRSIQLSYRGKVCAFDKFYQVL